MSASEDPIEIEASAGGGRMTRDLFRAALHVTLHVHDAHTKKLDRTIAFQLSSPEAWRVLKVEPHPTGRPEQLVFLVRSLQGPSMADVLRAAQDCLARTAAHWTIQMGTSTPGYTMAGSAGPPLLRGDRVAFASFELTFEPDNASA